jgi:hypothetical protein
MGVWRAATTERPAVLEGRTVTRALLVESVGTRPEDAAELRFRIDGAYGRFTATAGRDDAATADGPAYAVFEVWGDDRLLFRSSALRSSRHPVTVQGSRVLPRRRAPQAVDVSLAGIRELRLVTRYASELAQDVLPGAPARGCIWAEPTLLPRESSATSTPTPVPSLPTPVLPSRDRPPPPSLVQAPPTTASDTASPRDALRGPVVQLAAQATAAQGDASQPRDPPFTTYFAPVSMPSSGPAQPVLTEASLRDLLRDLLLAARRGGGPVFVSAPRRASVPKARPDDEGRWREAARRAQAYLLVMAALSPPVAGQETRWMLDVRLIEADSGRQVGTARAFLPGKR